MVVILLLLTLHSTLAFYGKVNENIFFDSSSSYIFTYHSKKSIDCSQGSRRVQQYSFHGTLANNNQQFLIKHSQTELSPSHDDNGQPIYWYWYTIQCKDDNDYWRNDGDDIVHEKSTNGDDGRFQFQYLGEPALFGITNKGNDECLDIPGGSHDNSVQLQTHSCYNPYANNQRFIVIPKQEYKCPFTVNSLYMTGAYFNAKNVVNHQSGKWKVYNYRTMEIRKVQMWGGSMQGSDPNANAHGRIEPVTSRESHDWEVGDVLAFVDRSLCTSWWSTRLDCPFAVLDTSHTNGYSGGYFRFDYQMVDQILGRTNWDGQSFGVIHYRSPYQVEQYVILWRSNTGGPQITDSYGHVRTIGHGRISGAWPPSTTTWEVGDVLQFKYVITCCIQKFVENYDSDLPIPPPINDDQPLENIIINKYLFISIVILSILVILCSVYLWYKQCCTFRKKPKYEPVKVIDSESEAEMVQINK